MHLFRVQKENHKTNTHTERTPKKTRERTVLLRGLHYRVRKANFEMALMLNN